VAVKKLYTVCALTYWLGKVSDVIVGFTVARSDEEVSAIVRKHVKPNKTFSVHMASTGGPTKPDVAKREAELFLHYGFDWLDPEGPEGAGTQPAPVRVKSLMTEGHAL
jgi:hypothetical protein